MKESDLFLFGEWEQLHREAQEAEFVASHPGSRGDSTNAALVATATELRRSADDLFAELLRRNAFGDLAAMPRVRSADAIGDRDAPTAT